MAAGEMADETAAHIGFGHGQRQNLIVASGSAGLPTAAASFYGSIFLQKGDFVVPRIKYGIGGSERLF
jgi:hypothetical protein